MNESREVAKATRQAVVFWCVFLLLVDVLVLAVYADLHRQIGGAITSVMVLDVALDSVLFRKFTRTADRLLGNLD